MSDVIEFYGADNLIIWKHPVVEVTTKTTVVVPPNCVCLYMHNGQELRELTGGTYSLIEKKGFFAKKESFRSPFLYVSFTNFLKTQWFTNTPIEVIDSKTNLPVSLRVKGAYEINVNDAKKFVLAVGGLNKDYSTEMLLSFVYDILISKLKEHFARNMNNNHIDIYNLWNNMSNVSEEVKYRLQDDFNRYGLKINSFVISDFIIPEEIRNEISRVAMDIYRQREYGVNTKEIYEMNRKEKESERNFVKDLLKPNQSSNKANVKYCPECGEPYENGEKFCKKCGYQLNVTVKVCPYCNEENSRNAKFCSRCGKKI